MSGFSCIYIDINALGFLMSHIYTERLTFVTYVSGFYCNVYMYIYLLSGFYCIYIDMNMPGLYSNVTHIYRTSELYQIHIWLLF